MNGISPQLQNQITQFQQVQQQLQTVLAQKSQMEAQQKELQRTVEELEKSKGDVYRNVGVLLIKVDDKEALKAELDESLETVGIRIRGLEKQEKDLRAKYEMLQSNINNAMGGASARSASRAAAKRSDDDEEDE
ncbi:prefoldin subunit beta [Candidatus Methanomethylophilus sp. 1R26]|uniref:prefoldin subunit beta n=1 Tax=Candidatus Methanomethylophilus sp. 1R26 TaxID=1769296 RepID=UPI0007361014|nr:prefoldin subunit beta [Candidatus Methanomethylophilus sp. 1R26]KUE74012.1 prefoldin subunit beta [Candidatus Methanomethylophilus sp. 1R26]TQS78604.1 MAG: prefoldin subunit beta [Methanomethylophilus alvi]